MTDSRLVSRVMNDVGQVARRRTLVERGLTTTQIRSAVASGLLTELKRGWIVSSLADADQRRAVEAGAKIGCVSALRRWGVWSGDGNALHLHARPSSHPDLAATRPVANVRVVAHPGVPAAKASKLEIRPCEPGMPTLRWRRQDFPERSLDWIVSPHDALAQAILCQSEEQALACIDSALHEHAISHADWPRILSTLPERIRYLDRWKDARAGSGNESRVRFRLQRLGLDVELQVYIPGVGWVDMLVEDLVAVEADGDQFHSTRAQRATDRARTLTAMALGVPTVRLGSEHLGDDWPLVVAALLQQLADARILREHRGPLGGG
ncbi:hypothetical protein [Mycetocola sp. 2940]|uniref:hypothetical protein n=1 Tax=Mycetocola sp. 2940 TaxID=3156452 RepID=UPI003391CE7E